MDVCVWWWWGGGSVCAPLHVSMCVCGVGCVHTPICVCVWVDACFSVCTHICVCVQSPCVCLCAPVSVCVSAHVCVWCRGSVSGGRAQLPNPGHRVTHRWPELNASFGLCCIPGDRQKPLLRQRPSESTLSRPLAHTPFTTERVCQRRPAHSPAA